MYKISNFEAWGALILGVIMVIAYFVALPFITVWQAFRPRDDNHRL